MNTPARNEGDVGKRKVTRPCSLEVVVKATDEHGVAVCQWADGQYAVRLDETRTLVDVDPSQLLFVGSAAA